MGAKVQLCNHRNDNTDGPTQKTFFPPTQKNNFSINNTPTFCSTRK